jgi:hypothetical protein
MIKPTIKNTKLIEWQIMFTLIKRCLIGKMDCIQPV